MKRVVIPWSAWVLVVLAGLQALVLLALPMVSQWRPEIEAVLSDRLAAEVSISEIGAKASLSGPYLEALNLIVERPEGRIEVRRVRMVVNWWSWLTEGQLTLNQLVLDDGQWVATGSSGGQLPAPDQWWTWLNRAQNALTPVGEIRLNNFDVLMASTTVKRLSVAADPSDGVVGRARVITESASVPVSFDWRFPKGGRSEHDVRVSAEAAVPLPSWINASVGLDGAVTAWMTVGQAGLKATVDASWNGSVEDEIIEGAFQATASMGADKAMEIRVVSGEGQQPGLSVDLSGATGRWHPDRWAVAVPELIIDSGEWGALLAEPDAKLERLLTGNRPRVRLSGVWLGQTADRPLTGHAEVHDLSVAAAGGVPSIGPVRGRVFIEGARGFMEFQGDNAEFSLPDIFPSPWLDQTIEGTLAFVRDESGLFLRGHDLRVQDGAQSVRGDLLLDLPRETEQSLHLELIADASRPALEGLLPIDLDLEVRDFLVKGIEDVEVVGGRISYSGPLGDGIDRTRRELVLDFPMARYRLKPLSDWPAFVGDTGHVTWQNRRARVRLDSADFGGLLASDVQVKQSQSDATLLEIKGDLAGDAAIALNILGSAGLRPEALASDVQLSGPLSAEVSLLAPVENGIPKGRIAMQAESLRMSVAGLKAPIEAIEGEATYVLDEGLLGETLTGRLLNQPVEIDVSTVGGALDAELSGRLSTQSVVFLAGIPLDDTWLSGEAEWRAHITGSDDGVRARIETEGRGLLSQLPAPLTKPADARGTISVEIETQDERRPVRVRVFDSVDIEGSLSETETDWLIRAPSVDLLGWAQVSGSGDSDAALRLLVETDEVRVDETALAVNRIAVRFEQQTLDVSFEGDALAGRVQRVGTAPLAIDLERLVLPEAGEFLAPPEPDPLLEFNPGDLPSMDIAIADLLRGETRYRDVRVTTVQGSDRLDVTRLAFARDGQRFTGEMAWQWTEAGPKTAITLRAEGAELGQFLRVNEREPILEASQGVFAAEFTWDGSPLGFSILTSDGRISLSLKDGRFVDLGNSAEVLRLFGILNIETLTRRLRLDFLDLVKPGVAFDQVVATASVSDGLLTLDPEMAMEGPSSSFRLTGTANLSEKTLDQRLEIDIPLTNNLPLASVLLGAPQVGGAIYLVEKALGTKIIKVGKTDYRIEGSFDEPNIRIIPPFIGQKESSNVDATTNGQ